MRQKRMTTAALVAVSAALLAGGCAPKETPVQGPSAATPEAASAAQPATLDGTSWVLASLPGKELVSGATATISFQDGRAAGSDSCNRFTMPYSVEGATISFPGQAAGTMMACPPGVQEQAQAFTTALSGAQGWAVADGLLTLKDADGNELATFTEQRQGLAGTSWSATGINNGREALVSLVADSTVTLDFSTDGRVSGSAGCNDFTAGFQQDGSAVKFTPAALTRKMCPDPKVMEQETAFVRALEASTTSAVEGNRLTLRDANGAMQVTASRK